MPFYNGGLWRPSTPAREQIQSALTPSAAGPSPSMTSGGSSYSFPRAPYANLQPASSQKALQPSETAAYGGSGKKMTAGQAATALQDNYDKYNITYRKLFDKQVAAGEVKGMKPAQAGVPIVAAAAAAAPLIKTGLGLAAGFLVDRGIDKITGGSTGGDSMNGSRYGGWTDWGVEGPGVFNPKDVTPTMYGSVTKQWVANGTLFQRNEDGTISVQRKDGTVKTYRPYKPIVFGKKTDAKKLARVAKKHRSIYKELHKMFGTKTRRAK